MESYTLEGRPSRPSRLPRSRSTSHMLDAVSGSQSMARDESRDREKMEVDNLRNLAEFFRTTGPPSNPHGSFDNRPDVSTPGARRRWSTKSLRKEWRSKSQAMSLSYLPNSAVPGKTTDGHRYVAISIPSEHNHITRLRSQSSSSAPLDRLANRQEWPERTTSRKGWSRSLTTSISSQTLSRVIRSDNVRPRTRSSVGKEGDLSYSSTKIAVSEALKTNVTPAGEFYSHEPTARDGRSTADHALADGNRATAQTPSVEFGPSSVHHKPTILEGGFKLSLSPMEDQRPRFKQSGLDGLGTSSTSQQCLALNPSTLAPLTLAPPRDTLVPESPGFPKMLAAITFPSPPTRSRSPSLEKGIDSTTPPRVRPRKSSKRALTLTAANGVPTASLDELVMQSTRPVPPHTEPSDGLRDSNIPENCAAAKIVPTSSADITKSAQDVPLETDDSKSKPLSVACSIPAGPDHDPLASAISDTANSEKQSVLSDTATTTSSPWTPPTTNESYNTLMRSSATSAITLTPDVNEVTRHHCPTHLVSIPNSTLSQSSHDEDSNATNLRSGGCKKHPSDESAIDGPMSISASQDADGRKSIIERRIARKAKVQEYKRRDLGVAQFSLKSTALGSITAESKDSPILGWFPDSVAYPRKLSLREPSHISTSQFKSTHSGLNARATNLSLPNRNNSTSAETQTTPITDVVKPGSTAPDSNNPWSFSSIMITETIPEPCIYTSTPSLGTNKITMSPIMVVVDSKPRLGSPTLSVSPIHTPVTPHPPSRLSLKHKLKIIPQSRQKSTPIMIHRNPATGDVERSTLATKKLNRHSLASMPTLPPSPDIPSSLSIRRRSHPVGALTLLWNAPSKLRESEQPEELQQPEEPPQPEESEWQDTDQAEYDNKWRAALVKERLQKEKSAREEEISALVAKTVGLHKPEPPKEKEQTKQPQEEDTTQQIETQLQQLEENGDAWLRVVKTLLANMSKTLEEVREDSNGKGLKMSEFTVDMDAEARRFSFYNRPAPTVSRSTGAVPKKNML